MATKIFKKLHDMATTIGDGDFITLRDADTLTIQISGTASTFRINFMASLDGVNWGSYEGIKSGSTITASSFTTSGNGELWEFDCEGILYFKADISSITGGNITVIANSTI